MAHFTHLGWSPMLKSFWTEKSLTLEGHLKWGSYQTQEKKYVKNKLGPLICKLHVYVYEWFYLHGLARNFHVRNYLLESLIIGSNILNKV